MSFKENPHYPGRDDADREAMVQAVAEHIGSLGIAEAAVDILAPFIAAAEQRGRKETGREVADWLAVGGYAGAQVAQLRAEVEQLRGLVRQVHHLLTASAIPTGQVGPICNVIEQAGIDLGDR